MVVIALLVGSMALLTVVHLSAMSVTGALLGARPTVVKLFVGPALFKRRVGSTALEVGLLPFGGMARFTDEAGKDDALAKRHPLAQALVAVSGNAALFLVGLALGASPSSFLHGFEQLVAGPLAPRTTGAPLLAGFMALLSAAPVLAIGTLAMKIAAFNMLPLPALNGFTFVASLVHAATGHSDGRPRVPDWATIAGMIALLAAMLSWLAGLYFALRG